MAELPADQAARDSALDITRSWLVQAPAGSGKTGLLAQRVLALLAVVDAPEQILAITFTRKAAAEMRERVLDALAAADGPRPDAVFKRRTWELARAALARDAAQGWRLRETPNRLRIQTFDSLGAALARQMPILSGLGAPPAVTEDAEPLYRAAARATLRTLDDPAIGPQLADVLAHLDNRQQRLEDLLLRMLARRDQWLAHAAAGPDGAMLDDALRAEVEDALDGLTAACPAAWLHRLLAVAETAATALGRSRLDAPGRAWEDLADWQWLGGLLLTADGAPRKRWTGKDGFPAPSEPRLDAAEKARRKAAKDEIASLAAELGQSVALLARWQTLRILPPRGLDREQRRVIGSLLRVLLHAVAELQLVFRHQGQVDFAEVQLRALQALSDPDGPTDLALGLDHQLRHLLVDEFQDTSTGQYRLIEALVRGWDDGSHRTLFAVGDPMQSIYRFREAEVGNFLRARDQGIPPVRLASLRLGVNFRSSAALVGWFNATFPAVLAPDADIDRGAVPYVPSDPHDDARIDGTNAVTVHASLDGDPAAEARRVVDLVHETRTGDPDGSIAILARARRHLHAIAAALTAAGIGYRALDVDPLGERPVVRDLHALTRALLHPGDRLAWLSLLRAPWLGLDMDDLLTLAEGSERPLPGRLRDPAVLALLSPDGAGRVRRLLERVGPALPARGRVPLRQWVEGTWLSLGGLAAAGAGGYDDAQAYLGLLERHAVDRELADFGGLERALSGLYASPDPDADDRLQLMTMHKAKGLEFDTVILPGLGRGTRGNDSELLYWAQTGAASGDRRLLMAPIRQERETDEPISGYLRALERDKQAFETARLLYVAATRARHRLHLFGHLPSKDGMPAAAPARGSLLHYLWGAVAGEFEVPGDGDRRIPPVPAAASLAGERPALCRLAADWQPQLHTTDDPMGSTGDETRGAIEFDWASDTARHVGTLVHRQLERIACEGIAHWPAERADALGPVLRRGLLNLGVRLAELDAATAKAQRALRMTLADDKGRWILSPHVEARCEMPLTIDDGGGPRHFVIDRTFVDDDGIRWIVDYKTGEHLDGDRDAFLDREQDRYRAQLEDYARLLQALEQRPIRLALYFPLFSDWRTWDFVSGPPGGGTD